MVLRETIFKDFVTLQRGFDLPKKKRVSGPYPVVASTSIHGCHNEFKVQPPGVVTGRSGALGQVLYIDQAFWPLNTTLWVRDFHGNDPRYVYYVLQTLNLEQFNSGAGVPTLNRNHLDTLQLKIHDFDEQRQVAGILSAYEDLIENNMRRIEVVEKMAEAVYREWFVDFRFPGHDEVDMVDSKLGPIPEGWEVRNLFDLAQVTYGYPFKSRAFTDQPEGLPVIRIRDVLEGRSHTYTDEEADPKYLVRDGDLLVGMDGDFHRGKWAGGDAYLNQRVARFRALGPLSQHHLFLALKDPIEHFNSTITGTTVAHLGHKHLRTVDLVVPTGSVLDRATEILGPMFELELNLRIENEKLREARDLLLPKLVSGEIDISALEPDPEAVVA